MLEYGILGLVILILDIWAVVKTLQSSESGGSKLLWILAILVFPVVGLLVWFFLGPRQSAHVAR